MSSAAKASRTNYFSRSSSRHGVNVEPPDLTPVPG